MLVGILGRHTHAPRPGEWDWGAHRAGPLGLCVITKP